MPRDRQYTYDEGNNADKVRDPAQWDSVLPEVIDATGTIDVDGNRSIDPDKQTGYGMCYLASLFFDSRIESSTITWETSPPWNDSTSPSKLVVQVSIDDGKSWHTATRGGQVPKLEVGHVYGGKQLLVRQLFLDGLDSPKLMSIDIEINWEDSQTKIINEDFSNWDAEHSVFRGTRFNSEAGWVEVDTDVRADFDGNAYLQIPGRPYYVGQINNKTITHVIYHKSGGAEDVNSALEISDGYFVKVPILYPFIGKRQRADYWWSPFPYLKYDELPSEWENKDSKNWSEDTKRRLVDKILRRNSFSIEFWFTPTARAVEDTPFDEHGSEDPEDIQASQNPDINGGVVVSWAGYPTDKDFREPGLTVEIRSREKRTYDWTCLRETSGDNSGDDYQDSNWSSTKTRFNGITVYGLQRRGLEKYRIKPFAVDTGLAADLFTPGRTYRCSVVYNGLTLTVYVNGVIVGSAAFPTQHGGTNGRYFEGFVIKGPAEDKQDPNAQPSPLWNNVALYNNVPDSVESLAYGVPFATIGDVYVGRAASTFFKEPNPKSPGNRESLRIFNGGLMELRIWKRGLSQQDVSRRLWRRLTEDEVINESGNGNLAAYFPLTSPVVIDDTTNAHNVKQVGGRIGYSTIPSTVSVPYSDKKRGNIQAQYRISPPIDLSVDGKTLYITNAPFDITVMGKTFKGVGSLGSIDVVQFNAQGRATELRLSLSSVRPDYLQVAIDEFYEDRPVHIWLVFYDTDGALIGDPMLLFRGRMDSMPIKIGQTATFSVVVESEMIRWEKSNTRRYNDVGQRALYPYDSGMEFVAEMVDKDVWWPARPDIDTSVPEE